MSPKWSGYEDSIVFKDKLKLLVAFKLTLKYTDNFES